jgi:hypothetical protein
MHCAIARRSDALIDSVGAPGGFRTTTPDWEAGALGMKSPEICGLAGARLEQPVLLPI